MTYFDRPSSTVGDLVTRLGTDVEVNLAIEYAMQLVLLIILRFYRVTACVHEVCIHVAPPVPAESLRACQT